MPPAVEHIFCKNGNFQFAKNFNYCRGELRSPAEEHNFCKSGNLPFTQKSINIMFYKTKGEFFNMKNNKQIVLSEEGLKKLEKELEELKTVKRKETAEKIKIARGFGDLSENSEYDEAKNEQAMVESRIAVLEAMLKNVVILDEDELSTETVSIGSKIKVKEVESGEIEKFHIVGSTEINPFKNKISDESPVGKVLIGQKLGATVEIEIPNGTIEYEIIEIAK